jgi:2-keto-4-pentenoate hydratase/2-oxohepta-3-ene-1,7-dioic acid hydratase in catechol pathway
VRLLNGELQGRFLRDGDTVEVEIDGLGTLVDPVRSERPPP